MRDFLRQSVDELRFRSLFGRDGRYYSLAAGIAPGLKEIKLLAFTASWLGADACKVRHEKVLN